MRQKYNGFYGNTNNYYYGGQNPFGNNGYGNGANNGGYGGYGSQGASGNDAKKPDEDDPFPEFKDK